MTKLEQSIVDLVTRHNLCNLSIDYSIAEGDPEHTWFGVSMQWFDPSDINHRRGIAHSSSDTIGEALAHAVTSMLAKRGASATIAEEALPELVA